MNCAPLSACFSPLAVRKCGVTSSAVDICIADSYEFLPAFPCKDIVTLLLLYVCIHTDFNSMIIYISVCISSHV